MFKYKDINKKYLTKTITFFIQKNTILCYNNIEKEGDFMNYIYVGKFFGTHGLKGEIKLNTKFTYIDKILKEGFNFYIGEKKEKEELKGFRYHKNNYLMLFKDKEDINLIEKYKNNKVYVLKEDLNLKENEFVIEDYINLNCYYNNEQIGKINDVVDTGNGNYIFVINGKQEILIPMNNNFIEKIDKDKQSIYFKNVEGLINED